MNPGKSKSGKEKTHVCLYSWAGRYECLVCAHGITSLYSRHQSYGDSVEPIFLDFVNTACMAHDYVMGIHNLIILVVQILA